MAARVRLVGRTPPSAVQFGPHVTNLGRGGALSEEHARYYALRARGGAGIIVTETASVHASDRPYEYAPAAAACGEGWRRITDACRPYGTLVLAGLGHRGMQGTGAHHRAALWGPSAVADPAVREMPAVMGPVEIRALVDGFAAGARIAADSGCDGVEVDAGPRSLLRQYASDLTNHRTDDYGRDRALLLRQVLEAVRAAIGPGRVLSLRLSCDERMRGAGITPDRAAELVADLAVRTGPRPDLITVVRGGLYSADAYRPGMHPPPTGDAAPGFNAALCRSIRAAAGGVAGALQGSVVDAADARRFLADGTADVVEMTRALIADPMLVAATRAGAAPRPCLRCNQACMADDPRNPQVDCVVRPRPAGAAPRVRARAGAPVLIVGAGVAGMAAARTLAAGGIRAAVVESAARPGGLLRAAAVARPGLGRLTDWLEAECLGLGVRIECGVADGAALAGRAARAGTAVIQATGGVSRPPGFPCERWVEAAAVLAGAPLAPGPVLVHDPIGGPEGAAVAQWLAAQGRTVGVVTPDPVVGAELARAGDLAGANVRLQRAGVTRHLFSRLRGQAGEHAELEHRHTGARTVVPCAVIVDCAPRLPGPVFVDPEQTDAAGPGRAAPVPAGASASDSAPAGAPASDSAPAGAVRVGDCVAPRTALEAMREGEAAARALLTAATGGGVVAAGGEARATAAYW